MIGSQASWGSSLVRFRALLIGLPIGVILNLGLGLDDFGVLHAAASIRSSVESSGDRVRDGEWNWAGGATTRGVAVGVASVTSSIGA